MPPTWSTTQPYLIRALSLALDPVGERGRSGLVSGQPLPIVGKDTLRLPGDCATGGASGLQSESRVAEPLPRTGGKTARGGYRRRHSQDGQLSGSSVGGKTGFLLNS